MALAVGVKMRELKLSCSRARSGEFAVIIYRESRNPSFRQIFVRLDDRLLARLKPGIEPRLLSNKEGLFCSSILYSNGVR